MWLTVGQVYTLLDPFQQRTRRVRSIWKSQRRQHGPRRTPYAMYNSQFESAVAAHVDKVDKLLEKDIDFEAYGEALYDDKRKYLEEEGGDGR